MALPSITSVDFPIDSQAVVSTTTEHPQNLYRITVSEAGTLKAQIFRAAGAVGGVFDTLLELYDSTGALVASNDDNGSSGFSLVSFAVGAGDYYVKAGHFIQSGFAGVFGFKVSLVTATNPAPTFADLGTLPAPASAFSFTQADIDAAVTTALNTSHSDADYQTVVSARDAAIADKTTVLAQVDTLTTEKATVEAARSAAIADKAIAEATLSVALADKATAEAARDAAIADKATAQVLRDAAIADKSAGLLGVVSNLDGVSLSAGSVTFSKTKLDYTAFDFDKTINANSLANKVVTGVNSTKVMLGDGNDTVMALAGNDTIDGSKGDDVINAGEGNNVITTGVGLDSITAGSGNDKIDGGDDSDIINAGDGINTVTGGKGLDSITAGSGNDKIDGGDDSDIINAGDGNNTVTGGKGLDSITSGAGNDKIDGGTEDDFIDSGAGSDTLTGGSGNDTLDGGNDADKIDGGSGSDRLISGFGNDTLTGGADADVFVLGLDLTSIKTVTDFKTAVDDLAFTISETPVALDALHLVKSATSIFTFADELPAFGYNTKTGALFYDADGSGSSEQVQIALIANKAGIVASDILVS